jgi:rhamnosyltransferase
MDSAASIGTTNSCPAPVDTVCAVIVSHHPDPGLADRVERIAKQVGQTVIVDNGSSESCVARLRGIANQLGAHLILNPDNEGLASALNTGARWAIDRGFRWILTLDQDTTVLPEMVNSLLKIASQYAAPERLAVVGSNYLQKENGKLGLELTVPGGALFKETRTALTSGSLVSLDAFQIVGGFREDFFVDCVDHEYCLRARAHGFRILVSSRALMRHGIGQLKEHRLLWKTVGTSNHPPNRQYFLARNSFVLAREYIGKEPRWILGYLWAWIRLVVRVCLFEEDRMRKMVRTFRGCVEGAFWRAKIARAKAQAPRSNAAPEDGFSLEPSLQKTDRGISSPKDL